MMDKRARLPQRDLELLSAYIDGQLNDRQTRRLEARLEADPGLRRELEGIRQTIKELRDLPAVRPSRHFTLTPEMVGQREPRRGFPVLRFATALAGLAFVALVGLEGLQSVASSQLAARAPEMLFEAEVAEDAAAPMEAPEAVMPAQEAAPEMEALEAPAAEEETEPLMMEEPESPVESAAGEDQSEKLQATPEAPPEPGEEDLEQAEGRANGVGESATGEGQADEAYRVEEAPEEAPAETFAQEIESPQSRGLPPLRWLQVVTGVLFILLSVLTITFRKRPT